MQKSKSYKFLLAGGKTGGHVFPLLTLAQDLKKEEHQVWFVSSGSSFEKKVLQDFPLFTLKVNRIARGVSFLERFQTLILIPYFMVRSFFILRKVQPDVVMGSGGSVSGPLLLVASLFKYPTVIWEFNYTFGLTNKILSFFVNRIFIHFEASRKKIFQKKYFVFSLPVRETIRKVGSQEREADGYFHVLILGGSQGAHQINQLVLEMYHKGLPQNWKILHQVGEKDFKPIRSIYGEDKQVECQPFIQDIGSAYKWADVVVSRAGSGVLSELSACGKASLIIPLQTKDGHQYKNAEYYSKKGATLRVFEKDLSGEKLLNLIMNIHGKNKRQLEEKIQKLYDFENFQKMKQHLMSLKK